MIHKKTEMINCNTFFTLMTYKYTCKSSVSIDQLEYSIAALSRVADGVFEWSESAALKLNALKTKSIICGSRDFVNRIQDDISRIVLNGISIPYVDTVDNLGVVLDAKFTWKPQVEAVAKRVNRALYSLQFFHHFRTFQLRKQLVSALALCHLDYCSLVSQTLLMN